MAKKVRDAKEMIRRTILENELIHQGEHIVLGLSGGPDSVCLFHVLIGLQAELGFSLYGVHVNHQLRPGAAEEDREYVKRLCKKYDIPCFHLTADCAKWAASHGMTEEEAGRDIRYKAFVQAGKYLVKKGIPLEKIGIAVAQNSWDQAETVLFRLLRGTGIDGLAGMAYERMERGFKVIRPLLDTGRDAVEAYCRMHRLHPRVDHTNLELIYTRNKIRLELIPYLQEAYNPNILDSLNRLSRIAAADKAYLWKQAEAAYAAAKIGAAALDLRMLQQMDPAIRHRVLLYGFRRKGLTENIGAVHLAEADRVLKQAKNPKTIEFPGGYKLVSGNGTVRFRAPDETKENSLSVHRKLQAQIFTKPEETPQGSMVFDWDKIKAVYPEAEVELRTRAPGDFIRIRGGRKKLQNFFVDAKVPKAQRDQVPIVAIGHEVLWAAAGAGSPLPRSRCSTGYPVSEETKNILSLEIICEL